MLFAHALPHILCAQPHSLGGRKFNPVPLNYGSTYASKFERLKDGRVIMNTVRSSERAGLEQRGVRSGYLQRLTASLACPLHPRTNLDALLPPSLLPFSFLCIAVDPGNVHRLHRLVQHPHSSRRQVHRKVSNAALVGWEESGAPTDRDGHPPTVNSITSRQVSLQGRPPAAQAGDLLPRDAQPGAVPNQGDPEPEE
jgi:hypothetical protein